MWHSSEVSITVFVGVHAFEPRCRCSDSSVTRFKHDYKACTCVQRFGGRSRDVLNFLARAHGTLASRPAKHSRKSWFNSSITRAREQVGHTCGQGIAYRMANRGNRCEIWLRWLGCVARHGYANVGASKGVDVSLDGPNIKEK